MQKGCTNGKSTLGFLIKKVPPLLTVCVITSRKIPNVGEFRLSILLF